MIRAGRLLAFAAILLAGVAPAQPPGGGSGRGGPGGGMSRYADPSGVISAEMAKGRLSAEKGESVALAKTGAKDAILFVPEPVFAQRWLKGQRGPQGSVRLHTRHVYMACDGQTAVSTGDWVRSDGQRGWYSTIWRRDRKAGFQWILSHDGPARAGTSDEIGEEIEGRVAHCKRRDRPQGEGAGSRQPGPGKSAPDPASMLDPRQSAPLNWDGKSDDGSLRWRWIVAPDKSRTLDVWIATEEGEAQVVADRVPPPGPAASGS